MASDKQKYLVSCGILILISSHIRKKWSIEFFLGVAVVSVTRVWSPSSVRPALILRHPRSSARWHCPHFNAVDRVLPSVPAIFWTAYCRYMALVACRLGIRLHFFLSESKSSRPFMARSWSVACWMKRSGASHEAYSSRMCISACPFAAEGECRGRATTSAPDASRLP